MKRFRWQLRALLVLGAVGFLGFAFNRVIGSLTDENRRIMPEISGIGDYLAVASLATLGYLVYVLVRYARPDIRERSWRYKAAYWALSLLIHAVVAAAVALLVIISHPEFPLGPRLLDEQPSPNGAKIGYLYKTSILCVYTVFVRHTGDAELRKVEDIPRDRCDETARLRWTDDEHVEVIDAQGDRMGPQTWDLHLGPR